MKRKRQIKSVDSETSSKKVEPKTKKRCEHGKVKCLCIDCGGSGLCKEHGRVKSTCKECGGISQINTQIPGDISQINNWLSTRCGDLRARKDKIYVYAMPRLPNMRSWDEKVYM